MNDFGNADLDVHEVTVQLKPPALRDILHLATQAPHERLHLHAGLAAVNAGTVTLPAYRALLIRLYGFYLPFERAVGAPPLRTAWLAHDLAWLGVDAATGADIHLCADIPRYDTPERQLGALYVVEGSALGGRKLCRGLDRLLGPDAIDGRSFFTGRGAGTGDAWRAVLDQLHAVDTGPVAQASVVGGAVATFAVFETWLSKRE
jgi:heme oxygenase